MIPKKIHYCWFGKEPIPKKEIQCMESWSKFMPDFEIILWDETRFNIDSVPFTKEAYAAKKYAFVSDYVRLYALLKEGGIYLDTDVEIVKPLDSFLNFEAFSGFETPLVIQTGVMGSVPNGTFIKTIFDSYNEKLFLLPNGLLNQIPNSKIFTNLLINEGLKLNNKQQTLPTVEIFPQEYFCPINQATQEITITKNTYCIHYLSGSWLSNKSRFSRKLKLNVGNLFGFKIVELLRKLLINQKL